MDDLDGGISGLMKSSWRNHSTGPSIQLSNHSLLHFTNPPSRLTIALERALAIEMLE